MTPEEKMQLDNHKKLLKNLKKLTVACFLIGILFIFMSICATISQADDTCTKQFEKCYKAYLKGNYSLKKCVRETSDCEDEERKKHPTPSVIDEIQARCAKKWPNDYEMQLYCTDTQVKAYIRIFEIKHRLGK